MQLIGQHVANGADIARIASAAQYMGLTVCAPIGEFRKHQFNTGMIMPVHRLGISGVIQH